MGFSTFGGNKNKKRIYDPESDSFIDGQGQDDAGGVEGIGKKQKSGENVVPLGRERVFGMGVKVPKINEDEIDLEIGSSPEAEMDGDAAATPPALHPTPSRNPTQPLPPSPRRHLLSTIQQQIDAITTTTSHIADTSLLPSGKQSGYGNSRRSRGQKQGQNGNYASRGGKEWYDGYFDPSFLRNPWEGLERERGWGPRGIWPEEVK